MSLPIHLPPLNPEGEVDPQVAEVLLRWVQARYDARWKVPRGGAYTINDLLNILRDSLGILEDCISGRPPAGAPPINLATARYAADLTQNQYKDLLAGRLAGWWRPPWMRPVRPSKDEERTRRRIATFEALLLPGSGACDSERAQAQQHLNRLRRQQ